MPHRYGAPHDPRKVHLVDPMVARTGTACGMTITTTVRTTTALEDTTCKRCLKAAL